MVRKELVEYIIDAELSGYERDQIYAQLRKKGHKQHEIDEAFREYYKTGIKQGRADFDLSMAHKLPASFHPKPATFKYLFVNSRPALYILMATIALIFLVYILFLIYLSR